MIEVRPVKIAIIAVAPFFLVYHVPAAIDALLVDDREAVLRRSSRREPRRAVLQERA